MARCRLPLTWCCGCFQGCLTGSSYVRKCSWNFALPPALLGAPPAFRGLARQQQRPRSLASRGAGALCHLPGASLTPAQAACHGSLERCSLQLGEHAANRAGAARSCRASFLMVHGTATSLPSLCISLCMSSKMKSSESHEMHRYIISVFLALKAINLCLC